MCMVHSTCNLPNVNQQKSLLEHTVSIYDASIPTMMIREKDQANEWHRPGVKSSAMAVSNRFGCKVVVALGMDVRGICYYEVLAKGEDDKYRSIS